MKIYSVQFVCLGNICRSPLAHAVFERMVAEAHLSDQIKIESSGTGSWNVGKLPDSRMRAIAAKDGYVMDHPARKIFHDDIRDYDLILVMDHQNLGDVQAMARSEGELSKIRLFRTFDPQPDDYATPDPYYGGSLQFERVFTIVQRTLVELLEFIRKELQKA